MSKRVYFQTNPFTEIPGYTNEDIYIPLCLSVSMVWINDIIKTNVWAILRSVFYIPLAEIDGIIKMNAIIFGIWVKMEMKFSQQHPLVSYSWFIVKSP